MASKSTGAGPDTEDRDNPGDTSTNPSGVSADDPAEGADDIVKPGPDSPSG